MKKQPFVRTPYNYDMDQASEESGLRCEDKTRTQQSFAKDADINEIVKRFNLTGQIPQTFAQPVYADYEGIFDFQTAMNAVRRAQEGFDMLPAHIRARFHNQPQELLEFMADDENRPEAVKLGLIPATEPVAQPEDKGGASAAPLPEEAPTGSTPPTKGKK